jgi:hypothetical protein
MSDLSGKPLEDEERIRRLVWCQWNAKLEQ